MIHVSHIFHLSISNPVFCSCSDICMTKWVHGIHVYYRKCLLEHRLMTVQKKQQTGPLHVPRAPNMWNTEKRSMMYDVFLMASNKKIGWSRKLLHWGKKSKKCPYCGPFDMSSTKRRNKKVPTPTSKGPKKVHGVCVSYDKCERNGWWWCRKQLHWGPN